MQVHDFGSAEALLRELQAEAQHPARYPVRFILLTGLDAWREVTGALAGTCEVVRLSSLCHGDAMPSVFEVVAKVQLLTDRAVMVLPLGQILQLLPSSQAPYLDFLFSLDRPGLGRTYIPILDHGGLLQAQADIHPHYAAYAPPIWRLAGGDHAAVEFAPVHMRQESSKQQVIRGIRPYLECWELGSLPSALVVTELAGRLSGSDGVVSARVYRSAYEIVGASLLEGLTLEEEWGGDAQWAWLASEVGRGETMDALAGRLLNVRGYGERQLYTMWRDRDENGRWLTWLWSRVGGRADSLAGRVARLAGGPREMGQAAALLPLEDPLALPELVARRQLLANLGVTEMPATFWARLDLLTDPLARLRCLPGLATSCQERIVLEVGHLLRQGVAIDEWLPILQVTYPALAAYLSPPPLEDARLLAYLYQYALSRICDEPREALLTAAQAWAEDKHVLEAKTRATRLYELRADEDAILWVDALGVEWLGMLFHLLADKDLIVEVACGRCNLPSITSTNANWLSGVDVDRELDQLAHNYNYSHPRSFVRELDFVVRLCERVGVACETQGRVVLTGDHGLTRFAASGQAVDLPNGYKPHKWGRHAEPEGTPDDSATGADWLIEGDTIILVRHCLFRGGARCAGEVHGGATPEECLVPVVSVRRRGGEQAPVFQVANRLVRLDVHGHGWLDVTVQGLPGWVRAVIGSVSFYGSRLDTGEWRFDLTGLSPTTHKAEIYTDLGRLGTVDIEIARGIQRRDLGL